MYGVYRAGSRLVSHGFEVQRPLVAPTARVLSAAEVASQSRLLNLRLQVLQALLASQSKPVLLPSKLLQRTTSRAYEVLLANISARRGGVVRFSDGATFTIAPHYLLHDVYVTVALSTPAIAESRALIPISEAMLIAFKPVVDSVAYAPAPSARFALGAYASFPLSAMQRRRVGSHLATFVKHVYLGDGTSTDFEQPVDRVGRVVVADLAAEHVVKFLARYRGTLVVSLQRVR